MGKFLCKIGMHDLYLIEVRGIFTGSVYKCSRCGQKYLVWPDGMDLNYDKLDENDN